VAANDRQQLLEGLEKVRLGKKSRNVKRGKMTLASRPKLAFLFTGQGSQRVGMGRKLFENEPVFRETLQRCDEILRGDRDISLISVIFGEVETPLLDETAWTQPALFALEYSLVKLLESWGILADQAMGHSVGEYVAACTANVFSLEDGVRLIAKRADLMQKLPRGGAMAVLFAPGDLIQERLDALRGQVVIAAFNGPANTTISGKKKAVEQVVTKAQEMGVGAQMLSVSHAFHSPLMEPMLDEFEQFAEQIRYHPPEIPIIANLTGEIATDSTFSASYWRQHIRNPVLFSASVARLAQSNIDALLEVGPSASLLGMARRCAVGWNVPMWPLLRDREDDVSVIHSALSELYVLGAKIDWRVFDGHKNHPRVVVPGYSFEKQRYWFEPEGATTRTRDHYLGISTVNPILGRRIESPDSVVFENTLSPKSPRYLDHHRVRGSAIVPASAFVEIGLAAAKEVFGEGHHSLENVSFQKALILSNIERRVQVILPADSGGRRGFKIFSQSAASATNDSWELNAIGTIVSDHSRANQDEPAPIDIDSLNKRSFTRLSRDEFYQFLKSRVLHYGPSFQVFAEVRRGESESIGLTALDPSVVSEMHDYTLHPAIGDGCMQSMAGVVPLENDGSFSPYMYLPMSVKEVRIHGSQTEKMFYVARRTSDNGQPSPEYVRGDISLTDENGRVLVEFIGATVQRLGKEAQSAQSEPRNWLYELKWEMEQQEVVEVGAEIGNSGTDHRTCLIFADEGGVGREFAALATARGWRPVLVQRGNSFMAPAANDGTGEYVVDPLNEDDFTKLIEDVVLQAQQAPGRLDIVMCWGLDATLAVDSEAAHLAESGRLWSGAFHLLKEVVRRTIETPVSVWLVTRGAQKVTASDSIALAQTPLLGLGRVATFELGNKSCRLIDLDPAAPQSGAAALAAELARSSDEPQIAHRNGRRYFARLERTPDALETSRKDEASGVPIGSAYRLRLGADTTVDKLRFEAIERASPKEDEVEIEVRAAGLNFSDVLKAIGLYPGITDEIVPLGIECAGVVTAVGGGVDRFKVGDEVMGIAPYCFASHCITPEYAIVPKPTQIDFEEAATIPLAFLTAYYSLVRVARLQKSERVLIHAGAGGVGMAAIQVAQHIGAEIFATAGSDEKREYLKSVGVEHVMDSRTLEFAEQIRTATQGEGVDVVLNSLPGDAIDRSLSVLRAYGRFVEIGKIDIYQNKMVGLLPFQDNLSYTAVDLDRLFRERPGLASDLIGELMGYFYSGEYRPLNLTLFPISDVVGAFRYMSQRRNIGKVILSMEGERNFDADARPVEPDLIRQDATYLITGGLGALGLATADWLVQQGARHVALMSRGAPSDAAESRMEAMRADGASVWAIMGDVADSASLDLALSAIRQGSPDLKGVIHAAGVLADGFIGEMDIDQFDMPILSKVQGSWNLHLATREMPLDFFVMYSSVSSIMGTVGQANYAAANAFLDALAWFRRGESLTAATVNRSGWAGAGMAEAAANEITARGMQLLPPGPSFELLKQILEADRPQTAVMIADWEHVGRLVGGLRLGELKPRLLERLVGDSDAGTEAGSEESKALMADLRALDITARELRLCDIFTEKLSAIMGLAEADLDPVQPLNAMGLDSLMAIELGITLESLLNTTIPMSIYLEGPSISTLAKYVANAIDQAPTSSESSDSEGELAIPTAAIGYGVNDERSPPAELGR